jgi:DeoR family transcriptional regulator, aga operon transcriptional repressor
VNAIERRKNILDDAVREKRVLVEVLSKKFGVSTVTIRSDLELLDYKNLLVRTHGGAVLSNRLSRELSFDERKRSHNVVKQKIAIMVRKLIKEGEAIILDSGSTTTEIALLLKDIGQLTVMTNGLSVAQNLVDAHGVDVHMTGGKLRQKSQSFYGQVAEENLKRYHFDKVILGVDGFDVKVGVTTHFEQEANLNRVMCDIADQIIVTTDSSKFDRSSVYKILNTSDIDVLITDSNITDHCAQALEREGVKIMIAH